MLGEKVIEAVNESHFLEWMVVLSTIALTLVTLALTWATYLVHKDSIREISHSNDNMYNIAKDEIESHHKHEDAARRVRRLMYSRKMK